MNNTIHNEASPKVRFKIWIQSIPIISRLLLGFMISVYLFQLIFGVEEYHFCLSPLNLYFGKAWLPGFREPYRLLTASFIHAGLIHLVMNMSAFQALGPWFERTVGSLTYLWCILMFAFAGNLLHYLISLLVMFNPIYPYVAVGHVCSLGFSGVLFSLLVVQTQSSTEPQQSSNEVLSLGLVIWNSNRVLFFKNMNISFLGHLCGALIGFIYSQGFGKRLVPVSLLLKIETWRALSSIVNNDSFISNPHLGSHLLPVSRPNSPNMSLLNRLGGVLNVAGESVTEPFSGTGYVLGGGQNTKSSENDMKG